MYRQVLIIGLVIAFSIELAIGVQQSIPFIHADDVHDQGITGIGVTVAVIDTGVFGSHPGLVGSIAPGGVSVIDGIETPDDYEDIWPEISGGHGTHMSLIITDEHGVAHDARILPIRVFDLRWIELEDETTVLVYGPGPDDIAQAVRYVIFRKLFLDPSLRVINLSLGGGNYTCPCNVYNTVEADAISDAVAADIITLAATGNEGTCGTISAPACVSSAVKVAANYDHQYPTVDYGDCADFIPPAYWVTCFSNIAADCNYLLAAPGYNITVGGFSGDGTSQATAHASGVAALMFDRAGRCGTLSADYARTIIYNRATMHDFMYPACYLSPQPRHINALAAVNYVEAAVCSPTPGDLNCDDAVDAADQDQFVVCMTGPRDEPIAGGCACADLPESPPDGDIDLRDFIHFQQLFGGGASTSATVTLNLTSPSDGQIVQPGDTVHWAITATVSEGDNAGLAAISVDLIEDPTGRPPFDLPPADAIGCGMEVFARPAGISNPDTGVGIAGYGGTPFSMPGQKALLQIGGAQNTAGAQGNTGAGENHIVAPGIGQSGPQIIAQGSFTAPVPAGSYVFRIENGLANVLDDVQPAPTPPAVWPVSAANVALDTSTFSITVARPEFVAFDLDQDGDVDMDDFAILQVCYSER